jgi:hypothetical protein
MDPIAVTNEYLARIPADKKALSDAYFEGRYWIGFVEFAVSAALYWLMLRSGWSARMRDLAERSPLAKGFVYGAMFVAAMSVAYVSAQRLHRFLARAPVSFLDADLRSVVHRLG